MYEFNIYSKRIVFGWSINFVIKQYEDSRFISSRFKDEVGQTISNFQCLKVVPFFSFFSLSFFYIYIYIHTHYISQWYFFHGRKEGSVSTRKIECHCYLAMVSWRRDRRERDARLCHLENVKKFNVKVWREIVIVIYYYHYNNKMIKFRGNLKRNFKPRRGKNYVKIS